jgi:hypothetical protein
MITINQDKCYWKWRAYPLRTGIIPHNHNIFVVSLQALCFRVKEAAICDTLLKATAHNRDYIYCGRKACWSCSNSCMCFNYTTGITHMLPFSGVNIGNHTNDGLTWIWKYFGRGGLLINVLNKMAKHSLF